MEDHFKVYIEQLRDGREESISEQFDPSFLEIDEPSLSFKKPVELEGLAYLADQELVFRWDIKTEAIIPCSICNEPVFIAIDLHHFYHSEPLKEIKSGVYNFKELLRETILLEIPSFAECCDGNCSKRKDYQKYFKPSPDSSDHQEGYRPFANL